MNDSINAFLRFLYVGRCIDVWSGQIKARILSVTFWMKRHQQSWWVFQSHRETCNGCKFFFVHSEPLNSAKTHRHLSSIWSSTSWLFVFKVTSGAMSDVPKLPDFFPRAPSACKTVAVCFFTCLNTNSVKSSPDDKDASKRGLQACVNELKMYDECMTKLEANREPKRFRVQEEYRNKK